MAEPGAQCRARQSGGREGARGQGKDPAAAPTLTLPRRRGRNGRGVGAPVPARTRFVTKPSYDAAANQHYGSERWSFTPPAPATDSAPRSRSTNAGFPARYMSSTDRKSVVQGK